MEKIKSDKELLTELRNKIAGRKIEYEANAVYWRKVVREIKANTQEKVNAFKSLELNEQNARKDKVFLRCIDEILKGK